MRFSCLLRFKGFKGFNYGIRSFVYKIEYIKPNHPIKVNVKPLRGLTYVNDFYPENIAFCGNFDK